MDVTFISSEFLHTLIRFAVCFLFNGIIINQLYYKKSHRRDFYFTFRFISQSRIVPNVMTSTIASST